MEELLNNTVDTVVALVSRLQQREKIEEQDLDPDEFLPDSEKVDQLEQKLRENLDEINEQYDTNL